MKRAVVVGTNYPGTGFSLSGCVNDAQDWNAAFTHRGFSEQAVLLDRDATKNNILTVLEAFLNRSRSGDLVVFTFSGHGTWRPGGPDEPRDECICPNDVQSAGVIADDDLFNLFTHRHRGVRAVMVADSCYSGTINRLFGPLGDDGRLVRFLPPEVWMPAAELGGQTLRSPATSIETLVPRVSPLGTGALALAGCSPTQVCYDASFVDAQGNRRANGAFTYAALKALDELPAGDVNYRAWMRVIRKYLPSTDFDQAPQLDGASYQKGWQVLDDTED